MRVEELLAECELRYEYSEEVGGLVGKFTEYKFRLVKGKRVGNTHHSGYEYIKIYGKLYPEHVLVFLMHNRRLPASELDHRDKNKSNNRIGNLRESSRQGNCANRETWNKLGYLRCSER